MRSWRGSEAQERAGRAPGQVVRHSVAPGSRVLSSASPPFLSLMNTGGTSNFCLVSSLMVGWLRERIRDFLFAGARVRSLDYRLFWSCSFCR